MSELRTRGSSNTSLARPGDRLQQHLCFAREHRPSSPEQGSQLGAIAKSGEVRREMVKAFVFGGLGTLSPQESSHCHPHQGRH